eukprot:TRINITY_DN1873_c0_g1_i2.p1 TRINITY_DN1873_c0_g1~~TRINITY_DN1873_c0_g1_i2.p1  ORF type:complete len:670 (+),score=60.46 TRINITY_DN1873_c0_g1_i2:183-2192(+)
MSQLAIDAGQSVAGTVDLTMRYSNRFTVLSANRITKSIGDLSQVGIKRNRFVNSWAIPVLERWSFLMPADTELSENLFEYTEVPDRMKGMYWKVSGSNGALVANRVTAEESAQMQAALKPVARKTFDEIIASDSFKADAESILRGIDVAKAQVVTYMLTLASKPEIRERLVSMDIGEADNATAVQYTIDMDVILASAEAIKHLYTIMSYVPAEETDIRSAVDLLVSYRLYTTDSPSMKYDKNLSYAFSNALALERTRVFNCPAFLPALVDEHEQEDIDEAVVSVELVNANGEPQPMVVNAPTPVAALPPLVPNATDVEIQAHERAAIEHNLAVQSYNRLQHMFEQKTPGTANVTDHSVANDLFMYAVSAAQCGETNERDISQFAMTRSVVVRHKLMSDGGETAIMTDRTNSNFVLSATMCERFYDYIEKPEEIYIGLFASIVSFLESGHHATAAHMAVRLIRMMSAVGVNMTLEESAKALRSITYHGSHPASMRFLYCYLLHRSSSDGITKAISQRISRPPPTFAAAMNLEIFLDSLHYADFFKFFRMEKKYHEFKDAARQIKQVMDLASPYAHYLYGESRQIDERLMQKALELAAYAVAVKSAMPESTLAISPALMKAAKNASVNSLVAFFQVDAFSTAYRQYLRVDITRRLAGGVTQTQNVPVITGV